MNRGPHTLVSATAAQVGHGGVDVGIAGLGVFVQQGGRGHQHAALAVTALRHLLGDPCGLQGVGLFCRAQGFDGFDLLVRHRRRGRHARAHRLAVHMHGAGPTSGDAAAEFGARKLKFIAQHPQQGRAGVSGGGAALAVDVQLHGVSLSVAGARC